MEVVENEYFITPDNIGMLKLAKEANTILVRNYLGSLFQLDSANLVVK